MARAGRRARQRARALLRRRAGSSGQAVQRGPLDAGQHIDRQQPQDLLEEPYLAFERQLGRGLFASALDELSRTAGDPAELRSHLLPLWFSSPDFVHKTDNSQRTMLHHAAARKDPALALMLLQYHADWSRRDENGETPLHLAAFANASRTVACLLEHGADVDAEDDMGRTPLMVAARFDRKASCEALIAAGADVKAFDRMYHPAIAEYQPYHWTALHYAARHPSARCMAMLIDAGPSFDKSTWETWDEIFDEAMLRGSTRGLYHLFRAGYRTEYDLRARHAKSGIWENVAYVWRVGAADPGWASVLGDISFYERDEQRRLVSLLRRHVAPRAPDDVLHVIVSFWGHPGSY